MNRAQALQVFGLPPTSTKAEVRRAQRTLALRYHPDRNLGDAFAAVVMRRLNTAREVLETHSLYGAPVSGMATPQPVVSVAAHTAALQ